MPSHARSSRIATSNSRRQRVKSISSIRSRKRPPFLLAASNANNAEYACPRCSNPVGLGAKRVTMADDIVLTIQWRGLMPFTRERHDAGGLVIYILARASPATETSRQISLKSVGRTSAKSAYRSRPQNDASRGIFSGICNSQRLLSRVREAKCNAPFLEMGQILVCSASAAHTLPESPNQQPARRHHISSRAKNRHSNLLRKAGCLTFAEQRISTVTVSAVVCVSGQN